MTDTLRLAMLLLQVYTISLKKVVLNLYLSSMNVFDMSLFRYTLGLILLNYVGVLLFILFGF